MYSPKIEEALIPLLYRRARAEGRPMTEVASDAVREYLERRGPEYLESPPDGCGDVAGSERRAA